MLRTILPLLFSVAMLGVAQAGDMLPIRGLHVSAPKPEDMPLVNRFIEALAKEGVNTLVMEFDYHYQFTRRPEVIDADALSRENVQAIAEACRKAGVRLIPQINLLGHQSWANVTFALLRAHPEFDETPGQYPDNQGIYCRSYCPLQAKVHDVVFDLIDELMDVTGSDTFHAGLDEVFLIGEVSCPRCKGKDKAELFAGEVKAIHDHLAASDRKLWIWGDRLLDGELTGFGKWEASHNGTQAAIRMIPKDVLICDWHYDRALPTASYFAMEGFSVVSSSWRKSDVALSQLDHIQTVRAQATPEVGDRMQGILQTTWCGFGPFVKAYLGESLGEPNPTAVEAAACLKALFRQIRQRRLN
jgi:hypothetical protein